MTLSPLLRKNPIWVWDCLYAGRHTLHDGPQVYGIAVAPATVAEISVGVDVEARVLILMVRVRTASDVATVRRTQISIAAGELDEVDLLS